MVEVVEVAESVEEAEEVEAGGTTKEAGAAESADATGVADIVEETDAFDKSEEAGMPEVPEEFEEPVTSDVISSAATIPPLPIHPTTRAKQVEITQIYLLKNEGEGEESRTKIILF